MPDKKAYYELPAGPEPAPPFPLPVPLPASPEPETVEIEYPSSDGQPMAENDKQAHAMVDLFLPLLTRYAEADNVYVGLDLLIYYQRGNNLRRVAPDVFVIRGVPKRSRDTYKIWEEGKPPDFVLEVATPGTAGDNAGDKMELYARLGVREYWLYDPQGGLHEPRLQGFALVGAKYRRLRGRKRAGVTLAVGSRVLDLELRFEGERLRLWDPATRQYLLNHTEENKARRAAESRAQTAEAACEEEEAAWQQAEAARKQAETEREAEKAAPQEAEISAQAAETRLQEEVAARQAAEQRVAELEAALKASRPPRAPPD